MTSTAAENPADHSETKTNPKALIKYIHSHGMLAGIAVKPKTPVDVLWDILSNPDKEEVPDVSCPTGPINFRLMYAVSDGLGNDSGAWLWRTEFHGV